MWLGYAVIPLSASIYEVDQLYLIFYLSILQNRHVQFKVYLNFTHF